MKKNHLFLCTLFLFCTAQYLFAEKISQQTALTVAKNFYFEANASKNIKYEQVNISEYFDIKRDGNSVYYAFNFIDGGFVIVSADDLFTPIIGFNTEGTYSETDAPENWKWLMNQFADMIAFGQKQQMKTNPNYVEMWKHLSSEETSFPKKNREVVVPPLCKAMWNQNSPYNYYAPLSSSGPGGKAYAGCVATAMSIIMHYWRWPITGTGTHSYNPNVGWCSTNFPILSADFGATEYHFDGMLNKIGYGIDNPIALLMYHCAVAVDMMFCHSGSGAYSEDVPHAIKQYFRYDNSAAIYDKDDMSNQEWKDLLKTDLNKGYPMYNSGCSGSGCHAFVCDGYTSDDLFHYNFGWGGAANGYYTVTNVGGFYSWQSVINNYIPDMEQYNNVEYPEFSVVNFSEGSITDYSGPVKNYKPNTSLAWLIDPDVVDDLSRKTTTIDWEEFDLAEGDFVRIYDGNSDASPLLAEYTAGDVPQQLKSSNSKVFIRFTSSPTSETANGFLLNYKTTPVLYCNGSTTVLKEQEGSFEDGSGEGYNYSNSVLCKWVITPENAQNIFITFNYFETEEEKDIVRIIDMTTNKIIASLSGFYTKDNFPTVLVPSGKAQIIFSSNKTINAKGFELKYKTNVSESSIEEKNAAVKALTVFPNPTSDILNLSFSYPQKDNIKIEIYNFLGDVIYKENLIDFSGNFKQPINIEMLSQGLYFLKVSSSNGISVKKIIKN